MIGRNKMMLKQQPAAVRNYSELVFIYVSFSHWLVITETEEMMGKSVIEKEIDLVESDEVWEGRAKLYKI